MRIIINLSNFYATVFNHMKSIVKLKARHMDCKKIRQFTQIDSVSYCLN